MPLGGAANFPYKRQTISISEGDAIILMSDGFPEMFNPENEMIGFDKAARILEDVADKTPREIINRFVEIGEDWAKTRPPDDDVTFVVLKAI